MATPLPPCIPPPAGADIDCQTVQGSTALMLACKRQHEAVVDVLVTAGAEMFVQDSRGRTARDTAQKRNNKNIIAMLQSCQQVRLMQVEARKERNHLMVKLYELYNRKRWVESVYCQHSGGAHSSMEMSDGQCQC